MCRLVLHVVAEVDYSAMFYEVCGYPV